MSIVGELDIYNNKLCVELHSFDFLSLNTPQITSTTQQPSRPHHFKKDRECTNPFLRIPYPQIPLAQLLIIYTNGTNPTIQPHLLQHNQKTWQQFILYSRKWSRSPNPKETDKARKKGTYAQTPPKKIASIASSKLNLP